MNIIAFIKLSGIIAVIDLIWLFTGGIFAKQMIENIQGSSLTLRWFPMIAIYPVLAFLLQSFATSVKTAIILGLAVYAVYDLTNYTTFTKYDIMFAAADTVWGGALFGMSFAVGKLFGCF